MNVPENRLKTKVSRGLPCLGTWIQSASPTVAEIVGFAGLDFAIIDQEHAPGDVETAIAMMRAMAGSATTPIVRVPSSDPTYLKRIADAGAQSILVPMVETAAEARSIVRACLYAPRGQRGNATGVVRASRYGIVGDYIERAHEQMLIIVQIETAGAVTQAGEIAAVPGVDMVFIGPADLSGSLGLPGQTGAPEVERSIAEAFTAIRATGKPVATVPRDNRDWRQLFADGYQLVAAGSDLVHIRQAAQAQATQWAEYIASGDRA